MDFLLDLVCTLVADAGLELSLKAMFALPGVVRDLRSDEVECLFSKRCLDWKRSGNR